MCGYKLFLLKQSKALAPEFFTPKHALIIYFKQHYWLFDKWIIRNVNIFPY